MATSHREGKTSIGGTTNMSQVMKYLYTGLLFVHMQKLERKHRLRYIGPFTVIKAIGENAVELKGLPERMPKAINLQYIHPYKRDDDSRSTRLRQLPGPPLS